MTWTCPSNLTPVPLADGRWGTGSAVHTGQTRCSVDLSISRQRTEDPSTGFRWGLG